MKKALLACVLAAACADFAAAQSVTLYGAVDAGVGYSRQDGGGSDVSIDSGTSSESLIGIRGSEALGGGWKASFRLESEIEVDEGTWSDPERFFDREAWLGLGGGVGEVRLGRQATFGYEWFSNVSPFETEFKQARLGTIFGYEAVAERVDNAVFYLSPVFGGFEVGVGYSFNDDGPEAPAQDNEVLTLGLRYRNGPVMAVVTYDRKQDADDDAAPGRADIQNLAAGGTYEIGGIELHAGYGRLKHRAFSRTARTEKAWLVGATVPLGEGEVLAGYQRVTGRNANELAQDADRDGFALAYEYPLSKHSRLYVYGSRYRKVDFRADDASRLANRTEFGVGVHHRF